MADPEQTARVSTEVGDLDAVARAAGDVPYERSADMTPEDHLRAYRGEVALGGQHRRSGGPEPVLLPGAVAPRSAPPSGRRS